MKKIGAKMSKRNLFLVLLFLLALTTQVTTSHTARAISAEVEDNSKVTTVFLVRHAERDTTPPAPDPPLNEAGKLRAQELARVLGKCGIKTIITSQYLRTQQTAEPLAKQLGITALAIQVKPSPSNPQEVAEEAIREITGKINQHSGEAILVVGHGNSVPAVIKALGGDLVPTIGEKEFDNLFVVTIYRKGRARVLPLKYGGSS